jgi:hypothetical protein
MDLMNILLERVLYDAEFRKPLPRQDGGAPARFALTQRAGLLGQRLAELCKDPKVIEVLSQFVANYRHARGGFDVLAARGIAPPAEASPATEGAAAFRVLATGAKPVRRGTDWALKTATGTLPLTSPEADAAAWLLARPDVTATELAQAHPAVAADALLGRLAEAGLLAPGS